MFIIQVNLEVMPIAYTSILGLCNEYHIPYDSAIRGKRVFIIDSKFVRICEVELIKIKGRGKKIN